MRTYHWLLATAFLVLSGGLGNAQAGNITGVNVSSSVNVDPTGRYPDSASGYGSGAIVPTNISSFFGFDNQSGKGFGKDGGLGFNFGINANFFPAPKGAGPQDYPRFEGNQTIRTSLDYNVNEFILGDGVVTFRNPFGFHSQGEAGLNFYQPWDGGGKGISTGLGGDNGGGGGGGSQWIPNGWVNAYFRLDNTDAIITEMRPSVYEQTVTYPDGQTSQWVNVSFTGRGFIPSSAYTLSVVPEPATAALLIGGGLVGLLQRKRRQQNTIA